MQYYTNATCQITENQKPSLAHHWSHPALLPLDHLLSPARDDHADALFDATQTSTILLLYDRLHYRRAGPHYPFKPLVAAQTNEQLRLPVFVDIHDSLRGLVSHLIC